MADRVGQQLGNYRLTRLLGRGGFAEVYLGEHQRLKTQAAIKVLHTQLAENDVEGFLMEAQFIASLEHPHIVRILDFDVEDSIPFLVMSYAPNGTLRQLHPKNTMLPLPTVVSYVEQVADALQYAHDEKLIHRDIKPENMLVGRRNEILLSDFGIALVTQSSRYQSTQEMAGTMAYMPPEQIQGKPRPASDQYALGIVVYEWLTGNRPFHGSAIEIVTQHLAIPPAPLREKVPTISPDVEHVVLTALAKDPKERFGSVQGFANALKQASQSEVLTFVKPILPEVQPPRVEISSKPVDKPVVTPLSPTRIVTPSEPVGSVLYKYHGHSGSVNTVAWSPDGKYIASGSFDGIVQVWSATNESEVITYRRHSGVVHTVAWSPDSSRIAYAGLDEVVRVFNPTISREADTATYQGHSRAVKSMAWSPNGTLIVSGSEDKTARIWDTTSKSRVVTYQGHSGSVNAVLWLPNGQYIASASNDGTVQVWDARTSRSTFTYHDHYGWVGAIACSTDGRVIASGGLDAIVQVWDAITGASISSYRGHSGSVYALTWLPDSTLIASSSLDGTVQVWNATTGDRKFVYNKHSGAVRSVAWSPDGKLIVSAGEDKTVQVWVAS